jgi:hypothetical protein
MDSQQVAFFIDRYSCMSDEELSYLLVTRGEGLSAEARHALQKVLRSRDAELLHREIAATAADISAQVAYAQQEAERHARQRRRTRTALRIACVALIGIGLLTSVASSQETGLTMTAGGVAMFLYFEARHVLRRFIAALFHMG